MKHIFRTLACVAILATTVQAQEETPRSLGMDMTETAKKFLGLVKESDRSKFVLKFEDPARLQWHGTGNAQRNGLQVRDMTLEQRSLCDSLLKLALSPSGFEKASRTMAKVDVPVKPGTKTPIVTPAEDSGRYFFNIYGTPASTGRWGWSFEGHHLSLNFVIQDNKVISDTPSFWGVNPGQKDVVVPASPDKEIRKMAEEEQLAFNLVQELNDEPRKKANIANKAPEDFRADGKPLPPSKAPQGLSATEMNGPQKEHLLAILDASNSHLAPSIATSRMDEIKASGVDSLYFAWAGPRAPGGGHYYRIQGPSFVLEIVDVPATRDGRPVPHMHSVWRSFTRDFGLPSTSR